MRLFVALFALFLGLPAGLALAHAERLAGADWVVSGETGPRAAFIRFEAGRVAGLGGCNRFGASYTLNGDSLSIGSIVATRMACAKDVMRKEQAFFTTLAAVRSISLAGDRLELRDGGGKPLATLVRRVAE